MCNVDFLPIKKHSEKKIVGVLNLYAKYVQAQVKEKRVTAER